MTIVDKRILPETLAHYAYLHEHPEVSFREISTCRYVCDVQKHKGIPYVATGIRGVKRFLSMSFLKRIGRTGLLPNMPNLIYLSGRRVFVRARLFFQPLKIARKVYGVLRSDDFWVTNKL